MGNREQWPVPVSGMGELDHATGSWTAGRVTIVDLLPYALAPLITVWWGEPKRYSLGTVPQAM